MAALWISIGVSVMSFFGSIGVSAFMSGMRWGVVQSDIRYIRRDVDKLLEYFRLTPAHEENGKKR